MKTNKKEAYASPEYEVIDLRLEAPVLGPSLEGGDKPVDDANEGDTSGWGWGNN